MQRNFIPATVFLIIAILACNAPTASSPSSVTQVPPPTITVSATDAPTSQLAFELPDIAGTANAQASATPDANQQAKIRGTIRYPSEGNPALRIYVLATNGQYFQFVTTVVNQGNYEIAVPSGEYYVLADIEDNPGFEAGYTVLGQCLAHNELRSDACPDQDHELIAIHIQPGQTLEEVDLIDWFPPDGTFPPVPG